MQFDGYRMYLCDRTEYNFCYLNVDIHCVSERSETPSTKCASRKYAWFAHICLSSYFKTRNICSLHWALLVDSVVYVSCAKRSILPSSYLLLVVYDVNSGRKTWLFVGVRSSRQARYRAVPSRYLDRDVCGWMTRGKEGKRGVLPFSSEEKLLCWVVQAFWKKEGNELSKKEDYSGKQTV